MTKPVVQVERSTDPESAEAEKIILTAEAVKFITELQRQFDGRRRDLLQKRAIRQKAIDAGDLPTFLPETAEIRKTNWSVAPISNDLLDRRIEITGPVDRKMIINALNSGANVYMADFEDSNSRPGLTILQASSIYLMPFAAKSNMSARKASSIPWAPIRPCCSCGREAGI